MSIVPDGYKNILIKVSYKGTRYHGWQHQPRVITIEGEIRKILHKVFNHKIYLRSSSRTDSGVHCRGMVANMFIPESKSLSRLFASLNSLLPHDIAVIDMAHVDDEYLVTRQNLGKRYIYQINNSKFSVSLDNEMYWWVRKSLDVDLMRQAAVDFVGKKNFSAFQGQGCTQISPIKTIRTVQITQIEDGPHQLVHVMVEGSGFLRNMIRIMVGTLVDIGKERVPPDRVREALASGKRKNSGTTAPAQGLILDEVFFPFDPFKEKVLDHWKN